MGCSARRSRAGIRAGQGASPRLLLALCLLVVGLVVLPTVVTVVEAAGGNSSTVADALSGTDIPGLLFRTLRITAIITPICGLLGVTAAWFVERTNLWGRRAWALLLVAPIAIPLFVTSYAWSALGPSFQGMLGGICIVSFSYYPLVFLLASASLRGMDPALEESARSLGCGRWRLFWRVILPQLRPALLGGLLLVALSVLTEYDAFVGIHFPVVATDIYAQYRISFSSSGAAALSSFSIVLCVLVLGGEAIARRNANYANLSHGARRGAARYELGRAQPLVIVGLLALVALGVGIPLHALISWWTQRSSQALNAAAAPLSDLWPATLTSLGVGIGSALLATALALPIAILATRYRGLLVTVVERATYLSFALPDLVAAIALASLTSHYLPALYGSTVLLVFAHAILFLPIAVVALRASLGQISPRYEEAARTLGTTPLAALRRVTLPLARPGIAAAAVLVFAFVLSDLSTTRVLGPPGMATLGTRFQDNSDTEAFAAAAPYAGVLMLLSAGATYMLMSRFGRTRVLETE